MPEQTIATTTTQAIGSRRRVDHWFYIAAALLVILLNVAGFAPSLLDASMRHGRPSWLVVIHGVFASAWLLLFLAQATLVATGRTSIHRRLGVVAPVLTVVVVVLIFQTTIEEVRRGYDLSGDLSRIAAAPGAPVRSPAERDGGLGGFSSALSFGILVAAGWWYRRRPEIHKRLMLVASLSLTAVPLGHLAGYVIGRSPDLFGPARLAVLSAGTLVLFLGAVHDKVNLGRIHPVSVWVPLALTAVRLSGGAVARSAPWREFAAWLAG